MHATKLGLIACVIGIVATTAWADDFTTDTAGRWRHRVESDAGCAPSGGSPFG